MMDHEMRPRTSLLDRLVKAIRPGSPQAKGSPAEAEPAMSHAAMDDQPGMMAAAPSMGDPVSIDEPPMDPPPLTGSAMESSAMGHPGDTDEPSMG